MNLKLREHIKSQLGLIDPKTRRTIGKDFIIFHKKEIDKLYGKFKPYLLRKSTPQFNFHKKWNKGKPVPLETMQIFIVKESERMYNLSCTGITDPSITWNGWVPKNGVEVGYDLNELIKQ